MDVLIDGFTVLVNGLGVVAGMIFSWEFLAIALGSLGLGWLAIIEIEEMNRRASKPETPLH